MKKMNLVLGAVLVSGMIFTGIQSNQAGTVLAAQETEDNAEIRAAAPQTGGTAAKEAAEDKGSAADPDQEIKDQMKAAALEDAGLEEDETTGIRIKKDRDDGKTIYDVIIYVDEEEYSYEIDPDTGNILESEYEIDEDYNRVPDDPSFLTREDVIEIVLEKVEGATEKDARVKYEIDDGREIYEGSIFFADIEYEFELNAQNGDILEWSEEKNN